MQARLWKGILDTYGTDHRYVVASQAPPNPVATPQPVENADVAALETLLQVDPKAKASLATWGSAQWGATPEAKAAFIRELPKDVALLYWDTELGALRRKLDTTSFTYPDGGGWVRPQDVLYTATDMFAGRPFQYAPPWGDAGDDLFQNRFTVLAGCFFHFRHFVPTPRATGFWNWHELQHVNPMMDNFAADFAWTGSFVWRGEGATTNRVVNDYLGRRYGRDATFPMAEAQKQALRGAPRAEGNVNFRSYVRWTALPAPGSTAGRAAVALALAAKNTAAGSPFYETDLVDLGRSFLHQYIEEQCKQALALVADAKRAAADKTYSDQAKKDALASLQKAEAQVLNGHKTLTRLIATRKDMCLDDAILEATATKGANKLLAQAIREHQSGLFAEGYTLTDSIEYHQQVAAPRLRYLLDYAKREANSPTAEAIPGWEVFFRHGASDFVEKAQPAPFDKKAEAAPPSKILQEFLEAAE